MGLPKDYLKKVVRAHAGAANLSAEEGFLLSRLGPGVSVKDLLPLCPWPEDKVIELLQSLSQKNAIDWTDGSEKAPEVQKNSFLQQLNDDEADPELRDLDRDFRREILLKLQTLDERNPYNVLDVVRTASAHEIKLQYLALSKKFHPDRFFRKKLGHYKEKLDLIFAKIQKSYEALKDPHQREILDRMQVVHAAKPKSKEQAMRSVRSIDPQIERVGKAEKFYTDGMALQKAQDFMGAYNSFALAAQTNPKKDTYKKALEEIRPLMLRQKAELKLEDARSAYKLRLTEEMFAAADEALRYYPDLAEAQVLWAKGVLDLKKDDQYRTAKERLLRAKAALPKNAEASFQLGRVLVILGDRKQAKAAFEETLKRDPKHPGAKRQLEEL